MNQTQLKYARKRAEDAFNAKLKAVTEKHTTPAQTLTDAEKIEALKRGAFTVNPVVEDNSKYGWKRNWWQYLDFGETFASINAVARDKESAEISVKFHALMDELILGDDDKAIALLREFESL